LTPKLVFSQTIVIFDLVNFLVFTFVLKLLH